MIISRQKPLADILRSLEGKSTIVIIGCGTCATQCHAGGEEEVREMQGELEGQGKAVLLTLVIESVCTAQKTRKEMGRYADQMREAEAILVMSCGVGVQVVAGFSDKPVLPALDTLFIGSLSRAGQFIELCSLCGQCIVDLTEGICPLNQCAKGLLNGPCGGSHGGKCELRGDQDCGWYLIYQRLKERGKLALLKEIHPPHDFSHGSHPQRLFLTREILRKK